MRSRDIVIGFIILVVLISTVVLVKRNNAFKLDTTPVQTPSIESKIKDTFNGLTIPADINKSDLVDVSGGDSFGIVTTTEVLASLPELNTGETYKVSLLKDEKLIQIGTMQNQKGGWILGYDFSKFKGYKVVVSNGTKHILEGSL